MKPPTASHTKFIPTGLPASWMVTEFLLYRRAFGVVVLPAFGVVVLSLVAGVVVLSLLFVLLLTPTPAATGSARIRKVAKARTRNMMTLKSSLLQGSELAIRQTAATV